MNAFDTPRNFVPVGFIPMLAALVLALAMTATPDVPAHAQEVGAEKMGAIEILYEESALQDATVLRRLLANPDLSAAQQRLLDRAMDGVYEELADASEPQAKSQAQPKGFIQSVNDLLGVKTDSGHTQAKPHAQG